jgi:hypothetical protein
MWKDENENPFENIDVSTANYFLSAIGNATHSNVDLTLLFECGLLNQTGESFDNGIQAAVEAVDFMKKITNTKP